MAVIETLANGRDTTAFKPWRALFITLCPNASIAGLLCLLKKEPHGGVLVNQNLNFFTF